MSKLIKIGVTDEITTCSCCGRDNLKRTVIFEDIENQDYHFYGSDCATKALGGKVKAKKILNTISYEVRFIKFSNGIEFEVSLLHDLIQNVRRNHEDVSRKHLWWEIKQTGEHEELLKML